MSTNVEDYGVKVSFDNSEFNSNIDSSEKKLNGFQNAISSFTDSVKQIRFNGNINLGELLNFAATTTGLHRISEQIRGLEAPIESVSRKALMIVNNTINSAIQQIKNGGMQRALNIEAAKFQIEGLKLDVDTFMEAADYAVSGTAYSLDAAAKAASQLGASGITQLEDLKKALRGISGVAAMANSSYEEIAHIFTTIAGQGKLAGQQMESFSYRGLNVAAEMGKAMGKTEQEIRDMVSKGKIDFKTFAMAMDDAFGEHAKDANKTFTGAMSNIKAALSRVGEAFATPIIQNAVDVFNQIRLSINEVKAALQDNFVFEYFGTIVEKIADGITRVIEEIRYAKDISPFLEEVSFLVKDIFSIIEQIQAILFHKTWGDFKQIMDALAVVVEKVKQIVNAVKTAFDEVFGIDKVIAKFDNVVLWLLTLLKSFEELDDSVLTETFTNWFTAIKSVLTAMADVLGITLESRKTIESTFRNIVKWVNEFVSSLKLSEEEIDSLTRIAKGMASVVYIVKQLALTVFDFIKPMISKASSLIRGLADQVLKVLANIGDFFSRIAEAEKQQKVFESFFESLTKYMKALYDFMKKVGGAFADVFIKSPQMGESDSFIEKIFDFISRIGTLATEALSNLNFNGLDFTPLQNFIKNIGTFGFSGGDLSNAESIFDKGKGFVTKIIDFIKDIVGSIFGNKTTASATTSVSTTSSKITDTISDILAWIKDLITTLVQNVDPALLAGGVLVGLSFLIDSFANLLDVIFDAIIGLVTVLLGFITEKDLKEFLSKNPLDKVDQILESVGKLTDKLPDILKGFENAIIEFRPFQGMFDIFGLGKEDTLADGIAKVVKAFAWLLVSIAGSLFIIALIPPADLIKAGVTLGIITLVIAGLSVLFTVLSKMMDPLGKDFINPITSIGKAVALLGLTTIEIAIAVGIMAKAIEGLTVGQIFGIIGIFLAMLTLVSAVVVGFTMLNNVQENEKDLAEKLVTFAGAFVLLGFAVVELAAGIALITFALENDDSIKKAWAATGMIAALTSVVAVILGVIGYFVNEEGAISMIAAGAALLLIFKGLSSIILAIGTFIVAMSYIDPAQADSLMDSAESLIVAIGAITIVLGIIGIVAGMAGKAGAIGIAAVAGLILTIVWALTTLASALFALAAVSAANALTFDALARLVAAIKDVFEWLETLKDEDFDSAKVNFAKLITDIAEVIPKGIASFIISSLENLKKIFPYVQQFISTDLINYVFTTMDMVATPLSQKIFEGFIKGLTVLRGYMPTILDILHDILFGPNQLLDSLYVWLDDFWDRTTEWLKERIPVWVQDLTEIFLILIRALNAALDDNWDEFDKEISELLQRTMELIKDIITGAKTVADFHSLINTIIEHIASAVTENMPLIKQVFSDLAGNAIAGFIEGLTAGASPNLLQMMGFDTFGGLGDALGNLTGSFSNIDLSGVFSGNNLPYNVNTNRINDYNKIMEGINNNSSSQTVDVYITPEAKTDNLFNFQVTQMRRKQRIGSNPLVPNLQRVR